MAEPTDYEYTDYYTVNNTTDYPDLESNWCDMTDTRKFSATFTSILYSIIFLLSLLGNSLVLWIVIRYESLLSLTNLFIMNLCLTDLAFSCTLPFWIVYNYQGWIFGGFLCTAVNAIFSISYYGGVIFLTIMTILRLLAVLRPLSTLRTQMKRCGLLVNIITWIISIIVVIPEMMTTQVTLHHDGFKQCEYKDHSVWKLVELCQQLAFFLVSFIIIIICYTVMLKVLLRSRSQRRHKTVRLIFAIVVVFFLTWAPFNILGFVYNLTEKQDIVTTCQHKKNIFFAYDISRKVAYCHCCLNPVLYVFVGVKFRRHLKRLCKQYILCRNRMPPTSPRKDSSHVGLDEDASMY